MWAGRACITGGTAPVNATYQDQQQPGNVPSLVSADGIWHPSQAAFYLNNGFHGLEWPTLPDSAGFANVWVCWHGSWKGTGNGNVRTLPGSRATTDCLGQETALAVDGGLIQQHRVGGLYALKGPNGRLPHNVSSAPPAFGTNDFTLEGWMYPTNTGVQSSIWDLRGSASTNVAPLIYLNGTAPNVGKLTYFRGGTGDIIVGTIPSANAWHHFALCRDSGTIYLYLDGVSVGSAADGTNFGVNAPARIGLNAALTVAFNGYLQEFRGTTSVARYPGGTTFTVPAVPFPDY